MYDDTINRQAAIDALDGICDRECEYPKKQRAVMCAACHLGSAFDEIDELPSAERHGRWVDVEPAPHNLFYATCSVCGERQTIEVANYCPMCGASMDGVSE